MERLMVRHLQDDTYQVVRQIDCDFCWDETVMLQGSLADCESYINLDEGGYLL